MPRTKLQAHVNGLKCPSVPPPNYVEEIMHRYRKAQRMTTADVGTLLGISGSAVRYALSKPAKAWKIEELQRYCSALNIPLTDALQAIAKSVEVGS